MWKKLHLVSWLSFAYCFCSWSKVWAQNRCYSVISWSLLKELEKWFIFRLIVWQTCDFSYRQASHYSSKSYRWWWHVVFRFYSCLFWFIPEDSFLASSTLRTLSSHVILPVSVSVCLWSMWHSHFNRTGPKFGYQRTHLFEGDLVFTLLFVSIQTYCQT